MDSSLGFVFFCVWFLLLGILSLYFHRRGSDNRSHQVISSALEEAIPLYSSNRSSGRSLKNFKTRYGGARNCLKVVVTKGELVVTAPVAFLAAFSEDYDLEHSIPKESICEYVRFTRFFQRVYRVSYIDEQGVLRTIELWPKKSAQFEQAMNLPFTTTA
jgi:hypothetical protein